MTAFERKSVLRPVIVPYLFVIASQTRFARATGSMSGCRIANHYREKDLAMNQREFEAELRREGYQIFYGGLKAGEVNPEHAHDWEARVMVIGGEITLTRAGKPETFRAGDSCSVSAGEMHAEHVGPQGVAYVAGRRATAR
jgi:quercetin dioxygenase-like cupin family protein